MMKTEPQSPAFGVLQLSSSRRSIKWICSCSLGAPALKGALNKQRFRTNLPNLIRIFNMSYHFDQISGLILKNNHFIVILNPDRVRRQ